MSVNDVMPMTCCNIYIILSILIYYLNFFYCFLTKMGIVHSVICSFFLSKAKEPPLSRPSKAALNPSVSSMSVVLVGGLFHSLTVLG